MGPLPPTFPLRREAAACLKFPEWLGWRLRQVPQLRRSLAQQARMRSPGPRSLHLWWRF